MNFNQETGERELPRRALLSIVPKLPKIQVARVVGKMISQKPVKNSVVYNVLKAAWATFGAVKMSDLEGGVMAFDFTNDSDRDRVLDMSPWAIYGHCLNLQVCQLNHCISEVDFGEMQIWVQIHGLSLDMLNIDNANQVASCLGKCLELNDELDMQQRGYIRMKTAVSICDPLLAGFWWTNAEGTEKWASMKYERLSDFFYGCGFLGHTS